MGRWEPDSRGRLQEAALTLFAEQGFESTTAAQIAARAGLTERTFFRHFTDKREVLFGGSDLLRDRLVSAVREAAPDLSPLEAVHEGLRGAAVLIGANRRDLSLKRYAVITATPELQERELAKLSDYADATTVALIERGVSEAQATFAAQAGMAVLRVALHRWATGEDSRELDAIVEDSLAEFRQVATG